MTTKPTYNHIPALRFPEFQNDGEWEQMKFDDTFSFLPNNTLSRAELNYEKGIAQNVHYGDVLIKYGECVDVKKDVLPFITEDAVALKYQHAKLQNGDVIIADTAEDETVGKCSEIIGLTDEFVVSGLHTIPIRPQIPFAQPFLGYYLNSESYRDQLRPLMQGVKVTSLSKFAISKTTIVCPKNIEEQRKIASCLSALTEMIVVVNKKLELLKSYKKGLMQKLFPAQGKTLPEYRFKEFEKDGEWVFVRGDELFETVVNKNHNSDLPVLAITQEQGAVPRDMIDYRVVVSEKSVAGYKVVEVGDFIISLRSFQGGIEYSYYKGLCSPVYVILRKKNDAICNDFFRYYFKSVLFIKDLNRNLEGIRDGKMISYQQFSDILIPFPRINEQSKIASCLSSIDEMIIVYTEKVAELGQYKKGLIQLMFPTPNK